MATVSKGYSFGATEEVTATKLHNLVDLASVSGIVNADISDSAEIEEDKIASDGTTFVNLVDDQTIAGDKTFTGTITALGIVATGDVDIGANKLTAEQLEADIADGTAPLVITSTTQVDNLNAEMVGGVALTGLVQQTDNAAAKGWIKLDGASGNTDASFNVSSASRTGTGAYTINWDTDFSSANYAVIATARIASGSSIRAMVVGQAAGSVNIETDQDSGVLTDCVELYVVAFGGQ